VFSALSAFQRFSDSNGQRVAMQKEGVVYYVHTDHLGSVSLVTDHVSEAVARQLYHPYGTVRHAEGTLPTDYTFTGQRLEAGLGLMHYGARFYSPRLGRFVSADVLVPHPGDPQSWNRYSYVLNSPLRYIDPTGHQKEVALGLWTFAAPPIPFDELALIPAGLVFLLLAPSVQQALMYTSQHAQYYPAVADQVGNAGQHYLEKGGGDAGNANPNDPFKGASEQIRRGVESLRTRIRTTKIPQFRKGYEAQLRRAEDYYRQGKLTGVEVYEKGNRFDLTLMGKNEIVEVKYWTSRYTFEQGGLDRLVTQLGNKPPARRSPWRCTGRPPMH